MFYKQGLPEEILTENNTALPSKQFEYFLDEWGIQLRLQCVHVPSGNGIVERCHGSVKRIAARKQCIVADIVYRYNTTPKDDISIASALANTIHRYRVQIKGIDGICPSSPREVYGPYRIGDPVWVKPPGSQCSSKFKKALVTDVISEKSISANETLHHVKDLRPALKTTPLVSDSEQESSESELFIELVTPDTGGSLENPPTDHSKSSSEEEVQPVPLRRSTRNKRPRPHCYLCDHETRKGCDSERESNGNSSKKRARLCLACRAEK